MDLDGAWKIEQLATGAAPAGDLSAPVAPADSAELLRQYLPHEHASVGGNRCTLLRDGVEAYPAMLEAIDRARRYVRLETYMFIDDAVGERFRESLMSAARRGVEVTVLYDAMGSWRSKHAFFQKMREAGVDARPFRPFGLRFTRFWQRDHRKILVIDGEMAFIGGINVASHWAPRGLGGGWRDDVLSIEGPAVRQLERRVRATWRFQVRKRLKGMARGLRQRFPQVRGDITLCVLSSRRSIHRAYLHAIERARRSVFVAAAYFVPDRRILQALRAAAARGVDVALVLNKESDHPWLEYATRHYYEKLLTAGVRIFEWQKGVLHAKTAVVDGVWGTLGSFNLERMSLHYNHEANVVFADERLGQSVETSFINDCGFCHEVTLEAWRKRPLLQRVLERICYVFRKVL